MKFLVEDTNKIDLHIHTECSDGKESFFSIIERAVSLGLECIAFADHNNDYAISFCNVRKLKKECGLKIIRASEISVRYNGKRLHLLAYGYNPIFSKLVLSEVGNRRDRGEPISLVKACKLIHFFGGKAIIAHPFKYKYDGKQLISELLEEGCLDGIECIHSYHTQEEIDYLLDICEKNNLYVSAGSDYHYCGKKIRQLGNQNWLGELPVSESTIEEQLKRAKDKYNTIKR
jgi:predicted metal-dependent phosphoesterase TrpH